MREKRNYERMKMDVRVLIFMGNCEEETVGEVTDISEDSIGLSFDVTNEQISVLEKTGMLKFQFIDTYQDGRKKKTDIVQALGLIKRMYVREGSCFAGCLVRDQRFAKYVLRKMLSGYFR